MLARLRQKAAVAGFEPRLHQASMSSFRLPRRYALILITFNAFVHNLTDLFVRRPFRRAGLGAAALEEARAVCASRGVRAMLVETGHDNVAAQAVYRRAGFVPTDRLHLPLPLADPTHVG